jgi:hypothetical protein
MEKTTINIEIMTPKEVYVSPNNEVLVTNFEPYYNGKDKELNEAQYYLEVNKWYKLGLKSPAPNADDFVYVIHDDYKHIGHYPKHFMSKWEWRDKQIDSVL